MLLSFLKFPLPVLRHRIFFRVSARFSFVYARQLVEERVRQNPAFVQNGENVAKTGQIGDIVPPATPASPSAATSGSTTPSARAVTLSASSNAKYGCGFRNRLDDGWHRLHGSLTPLRLSQIAPLPCGGSRPVRTASRSDCGWMSAALALACRNATIFRNIP